MLNGGLRSMSAAWVAAIASAVNVADPPMDAENASSAPGTPAGDAVMSTISIVAKARSVATIITICRRT